MDIRKILMKFVPAEDKLIHAWWGTLLSLIYIPIAGFNLSPFIGLIFCSLIAISVEVYQKITKTGVADIGDVLVTMPTPLLCFIISEFKL